MNTPTPTNPPKKTVKRRAKRADAIEQMQWYRSTSLFEITGNKGIARIAEGFQLDPPEPLDLAEMERLFMGLVRRLAIAENQSEAHEVIAKNWKQHERLPLTKADSAAANPEIERILSRRDA